MSDFVLTLEVETVGDKIAISKVEAVAAATDKAGKNHDTTAKKADGHRLALGKLGRALEDYTREATGSSRVTGELANAFGAFALGEAPMIAILGGLFAITKAYDTLAEHAKKAREEQASVANEFDRIAHLSVVEQGLAAQRLFSGDPFAAKRDENGQLTLDRFSLAELERQRAQFDRERRQVITGAGEGGATAYVSRNTKEAEAQFKRINDEIERRRDLLQSITGHGGTMELAGTLAAQTAMALGTDLTTPNSPAKKAVADSGAELGRDMAAAFKLGVREGVAAAEENFTFHNSVLADLLPSPEAMKAQMADVVKLASDTISEALANDPLLNFNQSVKDLADQMRESLSAILGRGIAEGFESAFHGAGIGGLFADFTASVLGGLGGFMEALGAQMIVVGIGLEAFATAVKSLNGIAAIGAGVALIAAGAGLKAIASSIGTDHMARTSGGYGGSYGGGLSQIVDRGVIDPNAYSSRSASSIPVRPQVNNYNTFLGHPDSSTVRWVDDAMKRAVQQGSFAFAAAGVK